VAALALFLALWELIGAHTTVVHSERLVAFTDLYGSERHAAAALECRPGGRPVLYVSSSADMDTLLHEFAHAYDCIDDHAMNASPIGSVRPAERPAWASDYCWGSDAEWYACLVVRTRSVRPGHGSASPGQAPPFP
jgi:hypothetical protein